MCRTVTHCDIVVVLWLQGGVISAVLAASQRAVPRRDLVTYCTPLAPLGGGERRTADLDAHTGH
jgi:hypothetical protein